MSEVAEQTQISYQDALKSSLNIDTTPAPAVAEIPPPKEEPAQQAQPAQPATPPTPAFDISNFLKETFGDEYADPEVIKTKLTAPAPEPIYKEPEFTNEESKKIYESLLSGDRKAVKNYLDKIELAASISEKSAAEIIKTGWKEEFGLTDAQAERRFSKTYSIADADLMEEEDRAIEEKLLNKQIEKEAEKYKEYFGKYNTEITLPSLDKPVPASTQPQASPEAIKADKYAFELSKNLPKDVSKIGYEYADEKSGLKISGQVAITDAEIEKTTAPLSGYEDRYLAYRWITSDGNPNDKVIKSDIYFLENRDAIINKAVEDAVHQTRIEMQKQNRNYQAPGAQVVTGDFSPTEQQQKSDWYRKNFM